MTVDKVIAKIIWLTFFGPPCRVSFLKPARARGAIITPVTVSKSVYCCWSPKCITQCTKFHIIIQKCFWIINLDPPVHLARNNITLDQLQLKRPHQKCRHGTTWMGQMGYHNASSPIHNGSTVVEKLKERNKWRWSIKLFCRDSCYRHRQDGKQKEWMDSADDDRSQHWSSWQR